MTEDVLGIAKKVTVERDSCFLKTDCGQEAINARVTEIRASMNDKDATDYHKEKLQERLAKLTGGVAVIKVGGMTEVEVREKKDRVDDAVAATRAAIESGVVPGGGVALVRAIKQVEKLGSRNEDQAAGIKVIINALSAPCAQIATNAGKSGDVVFETILKSFPVREEKGGGYDSDREPKVLYSYGYDVQKDMYCDLLEAGIIDPAKVVTTALLSAASAAGAILTTGAVISKIPEEKPAQPQMPMM